MKLFRNSLIDKCVVKHIFQTLTASEERAAHYNICGRAYARITGSPDWEEEVPEESRRRRNRGTALPTPRVLSHRPRQGRGSGHDAHKDGCRGSREATASRARGENASGKGCGCHRGGPVRQCRLRSRCRYCGRYAHGRARRGALSGAGTLYRRSCGYKNGSLRRRSPGAGGLLSGHLPYSCGRSAWRNSGQQGG